ncbi:MAG TPA: SDR family oxidoreductase [Gemmataceae bacterium]|nr:SDR family oxidoreductase [Gemmataceae bacterium]
MMSASPKTALVTGASAGIGYELSKVFAREGYSLVLVARNEARLREVAEEIQRANGAAVKVIAKDLCITSATDELFAELQHDSIVIDVLVNNAGFGTYGPFAQSDLNSQLDMIKLNVLSLTHLARLFLPGMIERRNGHIMNVASTAAFQPGPLTAVYYATKAYVLSFSEAISNELEGSGVTVSALCPGPTVSEFQKRAQLEGVRLVKGAMMDAATVAESGYRGMIQNKRLVIPGWKNRLLAFSVRFIPRSIVLRVARKLQSKAEA